MQMALYWVVLGLALGRIRAESLPEHMEALPGLIRVEEGTYILPNTCSLTSKHLTLPASKSFESAFRARSSIWYPDEFKFANNHGYAIEYLMGIYETVGYCP